MKLGELLLLTRDFKQAREKAELVLSKEPSNMDARSLLATALAGGKEIRKAVETINTVIKDNPKEVRPYMSAAGIHIAGGDLKTAEEMYRKAIEVKADSLDARMALASLYIAQKKASAAEAELRKAAELKPQEAGPLMALANFYIAVKRFDDAEKAYKDIVALKGGPDSYRMLAGFYMATGRPEKALDVCRTGIEKNPEDNVLKKMQAELMLDLGNKDSKEAGEFISKLVENNPNDPQALYLRGRLRLKDRKGAEAVEDLKNYVKDEPNSHFGHYYLGLAYEMTGNMEAAKSEMGETLKLNPGNDNARLALALEYSSLANSSRDRARGEGPSEEA